MRTNLFMIFIACLFFELNAFAQTSPVLKDCKTIEDSLQYLKKEFVESDRFVGKPVKELFQELKVISPLDAGAFGTSPYIDPEGESYLRGVKIFCHDKWANVYTPCIVVDVIFEDTGMKIMDFYQNTPQDKVMDYTGDYIIKSISMHVYSYGKMKI